MTKRFLIGLLFLISACGQPSPPKQADTDKTETPAAPGIPFSIINARTESGGQTYDIYLMDTAKIRTLNSYLKSKFKKAANGWIQINYFSDSVVAKSYFQKQFDNDISDKVKDKHFRFYIANYKYTPASNYDTLVFEH